MTNKYSGSCHSCGALVTPGEGHIERLGRGKWLLWCGPCYDRSDSSSYEDRVCGNRAYEDECARRCGV